MSAAMRLASAIFSTRSGPEVFADPGEIWKALFLDRPKIPSIGSAMPTCESIRKNSKLSRQVPIAIQTLSVYS